MTKTTCATVNAELKRRGIDAKLYRGNGYYYFSGPACDSFYSTSVPVYSISDMSVEDVMFWFNQAAKDSGYIAPGG